MQQITNLTEKVYQHLRTSFKNAESGPETPIKDQSGSVGGWRISRQEKA